MIITHASMVTAMGAAGLGWCAESNMVCVLALATPGYCNIDNCKAYVRAIERSGVTEAEYAAAVAVGIGDPTTDPPTPRNPTELRALNAIGKTFALALAVVGLKWHVVGVPTNAPTDSTILVWDPSARAETELLVMYEGSPVAPREYYIAGGAAGATTAELAEALRDLVDGDATMFDAIMSAV